MTFLFIFLMEIRHISCTMNIMPKCKQRLEGERVEEGRSDGAKARTVPPFPRG